MLPPASLAVEIKRRASALGFELVGITTAAAPDHAVEFQQWLAGGLHGEMGYLARNAAKRVEPQAVLPGARSIVVVGMNYWTGEGQGSAARREARPPNGRSADREGEAPAEPRSSSTPGRIACYAWGAADYHDLMGERLRQLAARLIELGDSGTQALWYVDTGPVLERDLAQRAGLGFVGKHTNLISRGLGNWVFLGAVLTTLELEPDPPADRTYCGTCTRCIAVCPTRAIVAPYRLDARRCISYLTIELKGSIPVELRELIGDRVFGCDDCLEVCPWNRFARESPVAVLRRRRLPPLRAMLGWTDAEFAACFRGTPVFRLKRGRLLRNVCVALGNAGGPGDRPALERAAADADPLVREHAVWALARLAARGSGR